MQVARMAAQFRIAAGVPLIFAVTLAIWCIGAVALLLAGVWIEPLVVVATASVLAAPHLRSLATALTGGRCWRWVFGLGWIAIPLAAAFAHASSGAAEVDVHRVHQILNDPSTLKLSSQQGGLS
jgi:hypothetical protein